MVAANPDPQLRQGARDKKRLWPRLALPVVGTVLALALGEGALRIAGYDFHLYPEHIEFGWPTPEVMESNFVPHPRMLWVGRDYEERVQGMLQTRPDLVLMGCSCTALSTYDETLVRRFAEEHPRAEPTIENVAHVGWSSFQGRQQMQLDVARIAPEVVTIFYGWNDHWFGFGVDDKTVAELNSSLLYQLRDLRLVQWLTSMAVGEAKSSERPLRVTPADFRANLLAMVSTAQEHGTRVVLVTAPTSHQKGKEPAYLAVRWIHKLKELVPLHQRYVDIVREVASQEGVVLCDLARAFERLPRAAVEESFKADGIHFTPAGSERVGQMLYDCLREHGIADRLTR